MSRVSKIKYNPALSVLENAERNNVKVSAIRFYLQSHFVDRKRDAKLRYINAIKKYLKEHPDASKNEVSRNVVVDGKNIAITTVRKYWGYAKGEKRLKEHNDKKIGRQKDRYNEILSKIPTSVIREYLLSIDKPKQETKPQPQRKTKKKSVDVGELKALIDEMKEVEKENGKTLQCLPQPTLAELTRWEEYDASKYLCYAFRKKGDRRKGKELLNLGNMCGGYGYDMKGVRFKNSEAAYICGLFSDNTPEHAKIQQDLIDEGSGFNAKKFIRTPNEDKARKDWNDFNQQWMLYVVWQKVQGNEEFRNMLMAIPEGAAIIEDTTFQHGSKVNDTTTFWGAKNNEKKDFDSLVKKYIGLTEEDAKKGTKKRLKTEEVNNFTDYGTFRGSNVMGKILMICRNCIVDGTEPPIDYELLKSKHIHLLGKELTYNIK